MTRGEQKAALSGEPAASIDLARGVCQASPMTCPLCAQRKARRACPALAKTICPMCCGTKRMAEIACPTDCAYLAGALTHPPAVVRRQRQRDFEFASPMVHKLSDQAYRLLLAFQERVRRYAPAALPPLVDTDIAEAAGTLASTLETASKGIIYEHQAKSLPAQRLLGELREALAEFSRTPSSGLEREAAAALRRIEDASGRAGKSLDGGPLAYVQFLQRLPDLTAALPPGVAGGAEPDEVSGADQPRLILP
jgi:hypothetical protein